MLVGLLSLTISLFKVCRLLGVFLKLGQTSFQLFGKILLNVLIIASLKLKSQMVRGLKLVLLYNFENGVIGLA